MIYSFLSAGFQIILNGGHMESTTNFRGARASDTPVSSAIVGLRRRRLTPKRGLSMYLTRVSGLVAYDAGYATVRDIKKDSSNDCSCIIG